MTGLCDAIDPTTGWMCTLPAGHTGPHQAWTTPDPVLETTWETTSD